MAIQKQFNIPWLADFRDPWTNIDFYQQLKLTKLADARHRLLEKKVMRSANALVTVTWSWAREMEEIRKKNVDLITNGFDPADFKIATGEQPGVFNFIHAGSLNRDRNPHALWEAMEKLLAENAKLSENLRLDLIGPVDFSVLESLKKHKLEKYLNRIDNLPHKEVVEQMMKAAVLLLPLNDTPNISGVVPGKLYEYIGSKRPILAIGKPDGDSARIMKQTNAGLISDFGDVEGAYTNLKKYFDDFLNKQLKVDTRSAETYSRENLAGSICDVLNRISEN
jgi:glycosyltransferase involved in cell wall biosynthesis